MTTPDEQQPEDNQPHEPFWKDEHVFGQTGPNVKWAVRAFIVAVVLGSLLFGYTIWRLNDVINEQQHQISANHTTRLKEDRKVKDELAAVNEELGRLKQANTVAATGRRDLACATRAFLLEHQKLGQNQSFLVFLDKRYHCAGFKLHK